MKHVISKDGTKIAYRTEGSGIPLILVDGALCNTEMGPMVKLMPLLSTDLKVFIYDRRGRGKSGNTEPYTIHKEIEDLEALIKEMGKPAYVFGLSSGATLALAAAE